MESFIFSPDDNSGLMRVPAARATGEALTKPDAASGERTHRWPAILPNGKAILFTIGSAKNPGNYADAKIAAYQGAGGGIYAKSSDGTGNETRLTSLKDEAVLPESWGPEDKYIAYLRLGTTSDIFVLQVANPDKPELFEARASAPQFLPDGKWISNSSSETGAENVYVRSFPATGGKWQISPDGGDFARWSKDGKELFYIQKGQVLKVDI